MEKFSYIPAEFRPNESEHIAYNPVYRAVKSKDSLCKEDFLPSAVEYKNQRRKYKRLFGQPDYGMSVFTRLDNLKSIVLKYPSMDAKINAYAKGFTTIKRGISTKENENHHVEYFLYDYEGNNPKDDFEIIEVRNKNGG